jgi:hypothetical protein
MAVQQKSRAVDVAREHIEAWSSTGERLAHHGCVQGGARPPYLLSERIRVGSRVHTRTHPPVTTTAPPPH